MLIWFTFLSRPKEILKKSLPKVGDRNKIEWKYDEADYIRLNQLIIDFDWSIIKSNDINTYAENFTDKLMVFVV